MIYLDHNATTSLQQAAAVKMMEFANKPCNASSIHSFGRDAKFAMENARKQIATLVGVEKCFKDYQITFTASGTESNNIIISNYLDGDIFIAATEHASISSYAKVKDNVKIIGVDKNGLLNITELKEQLAISTGDKKLVSVMLANNETGVIQPIKEITQIAHEFGALMHSDVVQAPGKIALDILDLDLDFASISGHKFGGPGGAGALIAKAKHHLTPLMIGGGQEKNLRSGTENIMAITGFGVAAEIVSNNLKEISRNMLNQRNKIESNLLIEFPDIIIAGRDVYRLPNTSLIMHPGRGAQSQLIALDLKGVAVSSGSACSSGKVGKSHVLSAMGYGQDMVSSAIRISVGSNTTEQEIESFLDIYKIINK